MRRFSRFGPIAVLAVTMVAPAFAEGVTVGGFYSAVAQAKRIESADAVSAEAGLRTAGFDLPRLVLEKTLTEGDMTAISRALGVAVTTQRPSQPVTASQMSTYVAVFGARLRAPVARIGSPFSINANDNDQGDDNNDQGRPHSNSKP
jgi:hypothetical protein